MSRFDMNLLGALDALLTERNVTRAASQIGVTQPTMSGMLQRLRYQLDDELLVRNGRGMELTHYANNLVEPVRTALLRVESLLRTEPQFDPATSTRTFTIMTSDYCTSIFMPRFIAHLARVAPGIQLIIEPLNEPFEKLISGEVDLCISADGGLPFGAAGQVEVLSQRLFSDEFVCVVAEDHVLHSDSTLDAFFGFPHVGVHMPGVEVTIDLAAIRQHAPSYKPAYLVADFSLIANMVAGTNLVGLVQRQLAELAARSLPLRFFSPPFDIPGVHEDMRWHRRLAEDPGLIWLRNIASVVAEQFFADDPGILIGEAITDRPYERGDASPSTRSRALTVLH